MNQKKTEEEKQKRYADNPNNERFKVQDVYFIAAFQDASF